MSELVTVYMQVYNTKKYLRCAIDSVLNQTYPNFQFILVDNGCTDGSSEIIKAYAEKDSRIIYIHHDKNQQYFFEKLVCQYATGRYFTILDSDDWLELDFLARMLKFALEHNLDIVCAGSFFHNPQGTITQMPLHMNKSFVLNKWQFADYLPYYHWYLRSNWGTLYDTKIVKMTPAVKKISYGRDTLCSFHYLRRSNRMGVLNASLHHYRLHNSSSSFRYSTDRFQADVILHNDLQDFLRGYGEISQRNEIFINEVYANALRDTYSIINNSQLTVQNKFEEFCTIAQHPATKTCYAFRVDAMQKSRELMLNAIWSYYIQQHEASCFEKLYEIIKQYCPRCVKILRAENLDLISDNCLQQFIEDDYDAIISKLFEIIKNTSFQSRVIQLLWEMTKDTSLLSNEGSHSLLYNEPLIYEAIYRNNYMYALEQMTGQLMEQAIVIDLEYFLQLYLSICAIEHYEPGFIYGKLQLGLFYFKNQDHIQAAKIAHELKDMKADAIEDVQLFIAQMEGVSGEIS